MKTVDLVTVVAVVSGVLASLDILARSYDSARDSIKKSPEYSYSWRTEDLDFFTII